MNTPSATADMDRGVYGVASAHVSCCNAGYISPSAAKSIGIAVPDRLRSFYLGQGRLPLRCDGLKNAIDREARRIS
jgi:hypothetical protein